MTFSRIHNQLRSLRIFSLALQPAIESNSLANRNTLIHLTMEYQTSRLDILDNLIGSFRSFKGDGVHGALPVKTTYDYKRHRN